MPSPQSPSIAKAHKRTPHGTPTSHHLEVENPTGLCGLWNLLVSGASTQLSIDFNRPMHLQPAIPLHFTSARCPSSCASLLLHQALAFLGRAFHAGTRAGTTSSAVPRGTGPTRSPCCGTPNGLRSTTPCWHRNPAKRCPSVWNEVLCA